MSRINKLSINLEMINLNLYYYHLLILTYYNNNFKNLYNNLKNNY